MTNLLTGTGWKDIHLQLESHGLFLVIIDISGRKYCFSTKGIQVREQSDNTITVSHNWLQFVPALLNSPTFKLEIDPLEKRFSQTTFNFQVNGNYFPIRDFRKLGINFQSTIVDVYWYITDRGFSLKDCYHIIHTEISEWNFDEEQNFIEFSIIDKQFDGDTIFPPGIINSVTIPVAPSESAGKRYPVVIGTAYKVPAYEISAGTMTRFLVLDDAAGEFTASAVALAAYDGDKVVAIDSQSSTTDGNGRKYNYINFEAAIVESKEITVDILGHLPADLASVIKFLFSSYSSYHDYYDGCSLSRISNELAPITLSMVFNDDVGNGAIHVIRERLLKQFPLMMYQDEGKLKFQHLLWTRDVTKILSFDKNIYSMTAMVSETPRANVFNSYNMNYGVSGLRGDSLGSVQRDKTNDAMCYFSDMRYGSSLSKTFDVPDVTDISGGLFVLNWMVETFSKIRVKVSYHVSFDCVNVKIWDTVRVYDKYQGWFHGPYFKVVGIEYREEKGLIFDLISLDDYYDVYGVNYTDPNEVYARSIPFVDPNGPPRLVSCESLTPASFSILKVTFDKSMLGNAALYTPTNYEITGSTTVVVTLVSIDEGNPEVVFLTLGTDLKNGATYNCHVINVQDVYLKKIDPGFDQVDFVAKGTFPRFLSAVVMDNHTIRVTFTEPMQAGFGNVGNYTLTGSAVVPVTHNVSLSGTEAVDGSTIDLIYTTELKEFNSPGLYYITVNPALTDLPGNAFDATLIGGFAGNEGIFLGAYGVRPKLSTIDYVDLKHVVLTFSEEIDETLAEIPSNYTIIVGSTTAICNSATKTSPTVVRLGFDIDFPVANNTLRVNAALEDIAGNTIDPLFDEFAFVTDVTGPKLIDAYLSNHGHSPDWYILTLQFDELMKNEAAVITVTNYEITGPARGYAMYNPQSAVFDAVHTRILLTVPKEMANGETYTVLVKNLHDLVMNDLDLDFDTRTFSGDYGTAPTVVSCSQTFGIKNRATVVFSEAMNNNAALNLGSNYTITGPASPNVSSVTIINSTTVQLNLATNLGTGNSNVHVINVCDSAGNIVNPSFDNVNFVTDTTLPSILSVYFDHAYHDRVTVTFDEPMLDDDEIDKASNYTVFGPSTVNVSSVTRINPTVVTVIFTANVTVTGTYYVSAHNVSDLMGNVSEGSPSGVYMDFTPPEVASIGLYSSGCFYVTFNEAMYNNSDFVDINNYEVDEWPHHLYQAGSFRLNAYTVVLNWGTAIPDDNYMITCINTTGNVMDLQSNVLNATYNWGMFELDRVEPTVLSAAMVNTTHIDVTFDKTMSATAGEAAHYGVTGGGNPSVSSVSKQTDYVWRLNLGSAFTDGTITVDCLPAGASHITDNHGNPVDDAHDSASFDYDITGPKLSSVSVYDHGHSPEWTTIELQFNEMLKNEAAITTVTNYTITGPANGYPVYNPDTAAFGADHSKVLLHFHKETCYNTQHTVFCQNLHDEHDNALNTSYDEAIFVGVGVKPGLVDFNGSPGSYVVNIYTILAQFSEDLRDWGDIQNYTVTAWPSGPAFTISSIGYASATAAYINIDFAEPLDPESYYTVTVDNSSVCDLGGNCVEPLMDSILLPGPPA